MKKIILSIVMIVLLAPLVSAQEKGSAGGQYQLGTPFRGRCQARVPVEHEQGQPDGGRV